MWAIPVEVPIAPLREEFGVAPYETGYRTLETAKRIVVRIDTDEDIVGWGETSRGPAPSVAMATIEDVIAPSLVGRKVWTISDFLQSRDVNDRPKSVVE